ncbi:MAG TPA: AI-2E family transporter [Bacteroidales bacterium]|nr:AI-2E family transporter [Bacteroidales bacterium]
MLRPPDLSRINRILLFVVLSGIILYYGREFFILVAFSGFLAMLMTPVSRRLEKHRFSRILSSLVSVLIIVAVIAGVIMLLSAQIVSLSEDFPRIRSGIEEVIFKIGSWIHNTVGISNETLKEQVSDGISSAGGFITGMVTGTFAFIGGFILILVFTFLFLLHREKYENFAVMLYREDKRNDGRRIIGKISKIAQQYLAGRLISIFGLAVLYLLGFSIIGLKNALLLSAIAAIMTFIPYVGPVLGGLVPFFMAIVSGSFHQAVWVVVIISLAQLFDNYFIEPYVVGGSVNISPFFTIFILILGGVVWGIAGVILFLPLLGILKIVFENVEGMEPYAYLIGDQKKLTAQDELWAKLKLLFRKNKSRRS